MQPATSTPVLAVRSKTTVTCDRRKAATSSLMLSGKTSKRETQTSQHISTSSLMEFTDALKPNHYTVSSFFKELLQLHNPRWNPPFPLDVSISQSPKTAWLSSRGRSRGGAPGWAPSFHTSAPRREAPTHASPEQRSGKERSPSDGALI